MSKLSAEQRKWNVLMTTSDYVEVEAETPAKAEMEAFGMYKRGEVRPEHPIFICEEADLIKENEDE